MKKQFFYGTILVIEFFALQHTMCMSGFGNFDIKTKDIWLENIKGIEFKMQSCSNDVTSRCGAGSSCNVTIGPCFVTTSSQLNAAPNKISFSRYLSQIDPYVINANKADTIMPLINLSKNNNYTTIIKSKFTPDHVSYMIIALPTNTSEIAAIKNLPLGLANYLKKQQGTIIKIYRTTGTSQSQTWTEIAEVNAITELNDTIIAQSNIVDMEILKNGDLALTVKDLKKKDGKIIPIMRVTYTRFK